MSLASFLFSQVSRKNILPAAFIALINGLLAGAISFILMLLFKDFFPFSTRDAWAASYLFVGLLYLAGFSFIQFSVALRIALGAVFAAIFFGQPLTPIGVDLEKFLFFLIAALFLVSGSAEAYEKGKTDRDESSE